MITNKKILVAGAGGFIAGHLIKELMQYNSVVGVDIKPIEEWSQVHTIDNRDGFDCRIKGAVGLLPTNIDYVINLACDHGGVGFLTTNDFRCLFDVSINLNLLEYAIKNNIDKYLFASSACVYNSSLQDDENAVVHLKESDAWPAMPDMKYGLEKLYGEEMCIAAMKQHGLKVYLPRIHGCYGPYNHFNTIREKAPNALLRKAMTDDIIKIWGTGNQKRSFMYVEDAVTGLIKLLESSMHTPINLGSSQTYSMLEVAEVANKVAGRNLQYEFVAGERGVASRSSDNTLIKHCLRWEPMLTLEYGLTKTMGWMKTRV